MVYYVYFLINPRTDKIFYIGKGCKKRMYEHVNNVQRGRIPNGSNVYLGRKIKKILNTGLKVKYKKIFITENEQEAFDREKEYIKEIGLKNLCNLTEGGEGGEGGEGCSGYRHSKNSILKISIANIGNTKTKGLVHTEESKKKMSEAINKLFKNKDFTGENNSFFGKRHTEETKRKMVVSKIGYGIGKTNSQYGSCWIYSTDKKQSIKIKKFELKKYIKKGWKPGRKINF